MLLVVSMAALGLVCDPAGIRVTPRPPDPILVDGRGEVDPAGVDALIAAIETQRGLRFIQRPTLELLSADDPRLASLDTAARALEACPGAGTASGPRTEFAGLCFPDPSLEWIECVAPVDLEQARRALRRLLDAQNYPRLARMAPVLRGDPGVAVRALLAASANGAAPQPAAAVAADPVDFFEMGEIEVDDEEAPEGACVAVAMQFLSMQEDREAAFRRPPLSTKELVSPKRYRAAERPVLLAGPLPPMPGCSVTSDESVGVARLIVAALANGGVQGRVLGGWRGDRGLRFACGDAGERWIYVAALSGPAEAAAFAKRIQRMLPADFEGRSAAQVIQSRVVVSSRGIDAGDARAWAVALVPREIVDLQGLE